jgi:hypothetical protein
MDAAPRNHLNLPPTPFLKSLIEGTAKKGAKPRSEIRGVRLVSNDSLSKGARPIHDHRTVEYSSNRPNPSQNSLLIKRNIINRFR